MTDKTIIGLVGETGGGKDSFTRFVKDNFKGVFLFRFIDPVNDLLRILAGDIKKEDQQWLALVLRGRFGGNVLGQAMSNRISKIKKGIVICNGIRFWAEYKLLKNLGAKIVYVTAESKTRWQRVKKRREKKDDNLSYQHFLKLEKAATEVLIPKIGESADFKVENNGSEREFYKEVDKIIKNL